MKKLFPFVLFAILFSIQSCSKKSIPTAEFPDEIATQIAANEFLDNWHKNAAEADFENYFGKIAEDGVYIGTAKEEVWTKSEFANFSKPFFDKGRAWDFTAIERNAYVSKKENYIWFDEILNTWMGICRGSGVLEVLPDNQFKIKQYVLSLTVPNDDIREVMKVIAEGEENRK